MRIVLITFAWKFYRFISRSVRHDPSVKLMGIPWEQLLSRYLPLIYFYSESEFLIWFLYYSNWTCPVTVPVDFILILKYFSYRSIRILHNSFMLNHESLKQSDLLTGTSAAGRHASPFCWFIDGG
jgi:hypothetical protein